MEANEIEKKLESLGFDEKNIKKVMDDVSEIIIKKTLINYLSNLNSNQLDMLKSLSESEVVKKIKSNKDKFPPMSIEDFSKMKEKVWGEYFEHMKS